jgi:hypothetical protein
VCLNWFDGMGEIFMLEGLGGNGRARYVGGDDVLSLLGWVWCLSLEMSAVSISGGQVTII